MTKEMNTVLELIQAMAEKITALEFTVESDQGTIKHLEERNKFMGEGMDNLRAMKQTLSEQVSNLQRINESLTDKNAELNRRLLGIQQACQHFKHEKSATIKVKRWMESITQIAQR
jgi:peptidoglycan hydrolase CwlO-like protein